MPTKLTAMSIAALKPKDKRYSIADVETGLIVIVQPSGSKTFAVRYRLGGGYGKIHIGNVADVTLADARERAREVMRQVRQGIDPAERKKVEKVEARAVAVRMEATIIDAVAEDYIKLHVGGLRSAHEVERLLRAHALPVLTGRPIGSITRADIQAITAPVIEAGHNRTANHIFEWTRALFAWALERGLPGYDQSPCEKMKPPAPKSASRHRVLTSDELRLVLLGAERLDTPWRQFVRLLILTGARRGEVAGAPWAEFSQLRSSDPVWELPETRTKNGLPFVIPLPFDAARMLAEMPRIGEKGLAFTVTGETPVMGFSDAKERLDAAILAIARKEAADRGEDPEKVQPLPRWTWHDLRRTTATGMASLKIKPDVIEAVLNHVSGSKAGVAGIYNRYAYYDEKKEALAMWAQHIASLGKETRLNLTPREWSVTATSSFLPMQTTITFKF